MSEYTPSQAEGERDTDSLEQADQPPRTTPSQAEGEDPDEPDSGGGDTARRTRSAPPGGALHLREEPKTPIQEEFDR
ncbi:hypothetical protein NX794_21890 [Streptomyces sp. LP11]|uniref:Uncharacterized protein n=1 Tax=Streptomyces pyxinicus TaxID=2970331 RepID=A0ABT2B5Z3_9ACTN|nr:hypothetical protein [Streptomyces sp. LP11]MCS0603845.1 hypothetical protein [Streptomyces sp. LP11]